MHGTYAIHYGPPFRFLQLPLPTGPTPSLTLRLPMSEDMGGTLGLPRFTPCPVGWLANSQG